MIWRSDNYVENGVCVLIWHCCDVDVDGLGSHEKGAQFLSHCSPGHSGEEEEEVFEKDTFLKSGQFTLIHASGYSTYV